VATVEDLLPFITFNSSLVLGDAKKKGPKLHEDQCN